MKKCVLILVLASIFVIGKAAAQEAQWKARKKNFVSVDAGVLVVGGRYERLITPRISAGVDAYTSNSFLVYSEFEIGAFARYYVWDGLFAELGLGYHTHSGVEDYTYEYKDRAGKDQTFDGSNIITAEGFSISPALGWKFDPGKVGGFFLEPGVVVPITLGERKGVLDGLWTKEYRADLGFGVSFGVVVYLGLGWSF